MDDYTFTMLIISAACFGFIALLFLYGFWLSRHKSE